VVQLGLQVAHLGEQRVVVRVRVAQLGGDLVEAVQLRLGVADALLHVLQYRLALAQWRLLQQDPNRCILGQPGLTVGGLIQAGHDLEQRRLAGTVRPDHADLRAGQEVQGDVVENDLVAMGFPDVAKGVDEFRHELEPMR
jgi:hypothetical protein